MYECIYDEISTYYHYTMHVYTIRILYYCVRYCISEKQAPRQLYRIWYINIPNVLVVRWFDLPACQSL